MDLFINFIKDYFYWVFIIQLVFVMFMGLKKADSGKRFATMFQSFPFFAVFMTAQLIVDKNLNHYIIFIPIALSVIFFIVLKKRVFPYNLNCTTCGKNRNWKIIIFSDETVCYDCYGLKPNNPEIEKE